jgi:hypothetical protein
MRPSATSTNHAAQLIARGPPCSSSVHHSERAGLGQGPATLAEDTSSIARSEAAAGSALVR